MKMNPGPSRAARNALVFEERSIRSVLKQRRRTSVDESSLRTAAGARSARPGGGRVFFSYLQARHANPLVCWTWGMPCKSLEANLRAGRRGRVFRRETGAPVEARERSRLHSLLAEMGLALIAQQWTAGATGPPTPAASRSSSTAACWRRLRFSSIRTRAATFFPLRKTSL